MPDLKETLKRVKLNESTVSMIIGIIVILVVGVLVTRYFTDLENGTSLPPTTTEEQTDQRTRVVEEGETLWEIAEEEYGSGYNWVDIADTNELVSPSDISAGQELIIPDVESRIATVDTPNNQTATPEPTEEDEATPAPLAEETATPTPADDRLAGGTDNEGNVEGLAKTSSDTYTVERGDSLWQIAEKVYGDGYRWSDIASENELVNPDTIHAGNILVLPE